MKKLAADEHPRVRLEAVRAASFFDEPEAIEVIPISQTKKPKDQYLEYVRGETMLAVNPHVKKAIAKGQEDQVHHAGGASATSSRP